MRGGLILIKPQGDGANVRRPTQVGVALIFYITGVACAKACLELDLKRINPSPVLGAVTHLGKLLCLTSLSCWARFFADCLRPQAARPAVSPDVNFLQIGQAK